MSSCSHIPNVRASDNVRTWRADSSEHRSYYRNVTNRRGTPKIEPAWYLREWMIATGHGKRGGQAWLEKATGWSKATTSQLLNGGQDLDSRYIAEAAAALKIEKHELLMHPEEAMALRQMRLSAQQIVRVDRLEMPPEAGQRAANSNG